VDTRQDNTADLVGRIRQATYSLLESCDCRVEFVADNSAASAVSNLEADARCHVLLVAREALTNVVRHANASEVRVEFDVWRNFMHLRISDNRKRFDIEVPRDSYRLLSQSQS
jgi:signal transduction histidine kinase